MTGLVLSLATPFLVGPLTFLAMQGIKTANVFVDMQSPWLKRILVAAIAFAVTMAAKVTGVEVACSADATTSCLELLSRDDVKAMVAALVAYALHFLKTLQKKDA
jgi:hypothetical protein